jgi:hypothetical protein
MKCPRCEWEHGGHQKFCGECGASLQDPSETGPRATSLLDLRNALSEAFERESATSEILRVISSFPTYIQPVLEAVAETAARLCETDNVSVQQACTVHRGGSEPPCTSRLIRPRGSP